MKTFKESWEEIKNRYFDAEHQAEIARAKEILQSRPFVLYGAQGGKKEAEMLMLGKIPPLCLADTYHTGVEPMTGLPIISPQDLVGKYCDTNIIITSGKYRSEIKDILLSLPGGGMRERILPMQLLRPVRIMCSLGKDVVPKTTSCYHSRVAFYNMLSNMLHGDDPETLAKIEETYNMLSDGHSKEVFIGYLNSAITASPIVYCMKHQQYFDPVVSLADNEVFVDCGAYEADTAKVFFEKTGGKYQHYYAFEPDDINLEAANKFFSDMPNATITLKGVYSCETTLKFANDSTASSISDDGETTVELISLDEFFADKPHIPTFIKMDIEGAEVEALKGARNIIRKHKPKLAICIYHKPEDWYEIPALIKSYRDDYEFHMRHYKEALGFTDIYDSFTELVLYAV